MNFDIETALQDTFYEAVKEHVVKLLDTNADWQRFRTISQEAKKLTEAENQSFSDDYSERIKQARSKLQRKAGSHQLEYPPPHGTDRFDKDAINRQAAEIVRHEHKQRLFTIRENETASYEALGEDIRSRGQIRGVARDNFERATDRRNGHDRRLPDRSR